MSPEFRWGEHLLALEGLQISLSRFCGLAQFDPSVGAIAIRTQDLRHIDLEKAVCLRSIGSSAQRVIARCHGMSKVLQIAMRIKAFYVLEFISERFDGLSERGQDETIIHELMHIPKNFGGGFHDHVTARNVKRMLEQYRSAKP